MTRRWLAAVAVFLVAAVGLASCGPVTAAVDLDRDLRRAGYPQANVSFNTSNGRTIVTVENVPPGHDAERVAQIVWTDFRYRVSGIQVGDQFFSRADLQEMFGPRNPAYDRRTFEGEIVRVGKAVAIGFGIALIVVITGAVVLVVLLVQRSRRKRAMAPAPAWGGPNPYGPYGQYGQYGYPQQQPQPPPYGGPPPSNVPQWPPPPSNPPRQNPEPPPG